MTKKYDYIIVGAGLFGSVFAYMATKKGKKCLVIDKRNDVGGNLYCENIDGINVHKYGPHIFHAEKKEIWDFVNSLVKFKPFIYSPIANYNGEIFNLPFNMNTFSKMWGISKPKDVKDKIETQRFKGTPTNLEEQAISLVGKDVYEKLIKGYTEKQWGKKCKELPTFIIKRLPVRYTYNNNYFNDAYQGIPVGGYNPLFEKLLEGVDVELNVDYLQDKEKYNSLGEKILYTGCIDAFYDYCFGELEWRTLKFNVERLAISNYQGCPVMNYTDSKTPFTRVIEHKHFEPYTEAFEKPKTVISLEYPIKWKKGMEGYYPINDENNEKLLEKYKGLMRNEKNVLFGGRLAEYKYYDMDDTIESALEMAKKELCF